MPFSLLGLDICKTGCVMKQAIAAGQTVRLAEIGGTTADGERHAYHISAVPLTNEAGSTFGALIFLRDNTAEIRVHQKYKELVARNTAVSLSGRIEQGNLVDVVQLLAFLQKTGRLGLHAAGKARIVFERGQTIAIVELHPGQKALRSFADLAGRGLLIST